MDAFNDELESFKDRIRKRAQAKLEEAMRQVEEVNYCFCVCDTVRPLQPVIYVTLHQNLVAKSCCKQDCLFI